MVRGDGTEATRRWLGASWVEPTLAGEEAVRTFRAVFAEAVGRLVPATGAIAVAMSGGLDSTYLAAVLAQQAGTGRHVEAYVSTPVRQLVANPAIHAITDDLPDARAMADAYADTIRVTAVRNDARRQPLDVAAEWGRRAGWPVTAPDNAVWLNHLAQLAGEAGASKVFTGSHGNWAFSPSYERAPDARLAARLARRARRVLGQRPHVRAPRDQALLADSPVRLLGPQVPAPPLTRGRQRHLESLAMVGFDSQVVLNPAAFGAGLTFVDPFTSPDVLEVAAAITPETWQCEPWPRGFARQVMAGAVPDRIRLRTERGAQSPDSWLWINDQRDRYLDEVDALASTPIVDELVDVPHLRQWAEGLPWGQPVGPPKPQLGRMQAVLALAIFIRDMNEHLREVARRMEGDRRA